MSKKVFITLHEGDFEKGFPVVLRIQDDASGTVREIHQNSGLLPPSANIEELFCQWQTDFHNKVKQQSRGKPGKITNSSSSHSAINLAKHINDWLNSGNIEWQKIRDALQQHLNRDDEIQIIIQTKYTLLRQLPWQVWDLFVDSYSNTEIALSPIDVQLPSTIVSAQKHSKVRILAVLGKSDEINIDFDKNLLNDLHTQNAEIKFLLKPKKKELLDWLGDKQGWPIFFFAGHSESHHGEIGWIYINENECLEISELKNSLKTSIQHGLVLTIFNSCDGLGLANQLAELHLPQSIVMREPVPDAVAQDFLQDFLKAFAGGSSFYASVRQARGRLEDLWNTQYPGASWLPVIFQNPAEIPLSWNELYCETSTSITDGEYEEKPYEPMFDSLLSKKSPSLFTQLQKIRRVVIPELRKIPDSEYSHDSKAHANQVIRLVSELYYPALDSSFNANELFVIGVLCLVHDIGMMPRDNCTDSKKLYNNHCQYSHDYVVYLMNNGILDNDFGKNIATLCLIHNMPINRAKSHLNHLESSEMRLGLIYSMFKIADMLEIEQQPGAILRMPPDVITSNIGEFDIDSQRQTITLTPVPNAEPENFKMWVQVLSERFQEAKPEFNSVGLDYKVIAKPLGFWGKLISLVKSQFV